MKLSEIAENICRPLEAFVGYPVVIAGGAVRDRFWGRKPQDYDLFILTGKLGTPMHNLAVKKARNWVIQNKGGAITSTWYGVSGVPMGNAGGPAATFRYHGWPVQIMVRPVKTVPELLDTFDYNICQFAYRYGEVTKPHTLSWAKGSDGKQHGHIVVNREAVTQNFALALRRGYRFAERYKLAFRPVDAEWLCGRMAETGEAGKKAYTPKPGSYTAVSMGLSPSGPKYDVDGNTAGPQLDTEVLKEAVALHKTTLKMSPLISLWFDEPLLTGLKK